MLSEIYVVLNVMLQGRTSGLFWVLFLFYRSSNIPVLDICVILLLTGVITSEHTGTDVCSILSPVGVILIYYYSCTSP